MRCVYFAMMFLVFLVSSCIGGDSKPSEEPDPGGGYEVVEYIEDLQAELPCLPDCDGIECGDDGCGGSCGTCFDFGGAPAEQLCLQGGCCQQQCVGKVCGDDGCGGSCGQCVDGEQCVGGQCSGCQPQCAGKECGDDDCGGSCGNCPAAKPNCDNGACKAGECQPKCAGKDCGSDGCTGTCGTCGANESCETGKCVEDEFECKGEEEPSGSECNALTYEGCCDDQNRALWCDAGELYCLDCEASEAFCGWMGTGAEWYGCMPEPSGQDPSGQFPISCDGDCTPSCAGKECGGDGCGGSCGQCVAGLVCQQFACVEGGDGDSCEGMCGEQAAGGCYCDDACFEYEDCCTDICDWCSELEGCSGCAPKCAGKCKGDDDSCDGTCPTNDCDGCCDSGKACKAGTWASMCGKNGAACKACSDNETCDNGSCIAEGDPCEGVYCGDGNTCTDDSCVNGECVNTPNTKSCSDGDPCTEGDKCKNKICQPGEDVCVEYTTSSVTVSVGATPDVYGFALWVEYDSEKVTFDSADWAADLANIAMIKKAKDKGSHVDILWAADSELGVLQGAADLLTLTFTLKIPEGTTDVDYEASNIKFTDKLGNKLEGIGVSVEVGNE